ncbi:TIGR03621 family F420-dependent LLM class oxidoreductase [Actinomadura rudentiformis]|uniref:TIGR03621 family F420-dependent LLM class oxidoreductase n=1 Tax=Actinomadura rudentiformis TaxID=359158 RepID=A0A6H9Y778_9ACTN|nr:TIGR03621 family F420-dependent LLM class oxidoreductase [Actinomadura rudentiformis]KAB2340394.1 TIGR03621 family F420-dependent LLM class oxidoreductase [Actinomadura rudentiformis]
MSARPFRFACQAYRSTSARHWRELARRVEALGYASLQVPDHYIGPGPALDSTGHSVQVLAAVPAIAMAAAVTSTLEVGARVLCTGYHHPVVLAKEAATLQLLSEGRFQLGLGAGWLAAEYDAMGVPFPSAAERIDRLEETLELVRQSFAGGPVDVRGEHVHATGFTAVPAIERPPPIMVGGGAPRVLRLAGARADIVSVNFNNASGVLGPDSVASSTAEQTRRKLDWVRSGAGERFGGLTLEIAAYFVAVDSGKGPGAEALTARTGLDAERLREFPHALVGSVDAICEELERRRAEYGFSYVTVGEAVLDDFAPVVARLSGR